MPHFAKPGMHFNYPQPPRDVHAPAAGFPLLQRITLPLAFRS